MTSAHAAVAMALLGMIAAPPGAAQTLSRGVATTTPCPLRIYDAALQAAVFGAAGRSPTLHRLLTHLSDFKVIVTVRWSPALDSRLEAATLPQVTVTREMLYLHIIVKPAKVTDHLVSVVAHEVQHAIEILESGETDSAVIIGMFKQAAGGLTLRVYCTPAATDAGRAVFEELHRARVLGLESR